jgi:WD40 repeat protein
VATDDSALHLLSYNIKKAELSVDFVIERSHSEEGVGGLEFCPATGNVLYSIGKKYNTKDFYSWKLCTKRRIELWKNNEIHEMNAWQPNDVVRAFMDFTAI